MKEYFNKKIEQDAKRDAAARFPNEACGFVIDDEYVPCENVSEIPEADFKIDPELYLTYQKTTGGIQAVVHSHNEHPHASQMDMQYQIASGVPWGLVNVVKGVPNEMFWWGDQLPIQDYEGRPFAHGIYDCYALCRDWYRGEYGIVLKECLREYNWWHRGENILAGGITERGFVKISAKELKPGDGVLFRIKSDLVNHSAVYLGDGRILHHLLGRFSRTEPLSNWMPYATHFLRYEG